MAKKAPKKTPVKKVPKAAPKKAAAPAKKAANPIAKAKLAEPKKPGSSLVKAVSGTLGKIFGGPKETAKATAPKKKKDKKAKGKADTLMEEDDLLASDEEIGSEEIPDLSEFDENETEEVETLTDDDLDETLTESIVKPDSEEIFLTDAEGRRYCRVRDCDQVSAVEGYCRFHYLQLWKRIQVRRKILVDGKLERYVEELTARYPDKFLEMIKKDVRNEKDFLAAIAELEIDESAQDNEFEEESQDFINEVRGVTTESGSMSDEEEF
jgi:hypothetical protein